MPLTEFLKMSKGKEISTQPKAFTSDDTSCRPDSDCTELVWENGQLTMQGQFSKARRGPNSSIFPTTHISKPQDNNRTGNTLKMTSKLSTMDSMLGDFSLPGSSYGVALDQDVEMSPWLNYTDEEESLHHEYTSDFLRELSGVTISDPTKKSGFFNSSVIDSMENVKNGDSSKSLSSVKTSGLSQFSIPVHPGFSKSGITADTTSKLHGGQPSTSSSITNFPYFSRLGFIRDNHPTVRDSSILESEHKRCTLSTSGTHVGPTFSIQKDATSHNQSLLTPANANSELCPSNQASVCQEDVTVKNNTITQSIMVEEEGNKEPAVAATLSVCSGNSLERASNAYAPDLKRKSRENTESDGPSDEADEESIGVRKGGGHRTGAKRGRAAEVHNQSERRRRDRINEKMRALQELIPNCNKVDKASMLDEAIEYLKTLQLQVQMLSMGGGMYMHPMMVPPGMQQVHGSQMPLFSPMGMGMGFGMNMPFQGPQYPVPGPHPVPVTGPAFHFRGTSSNLHSFGNASQGLPMHMQRVPLLPLKVASVSGSANEVHLGSPSSSKYVAPQSVDSNNAKSNMNLTSNQVTNKGTESPESDNQA